MRSLLASLSDYHMAMLRSIAALRAVVLSSNARDDAAAQLAAALAEPGATEATLAACSAAAQAAWRALVAAGGRMKTPVFMRLYGTIRPIGPGRLERERTWQNPEGPAEELWYHGLIYRAFADCGGGPAEYVYIPDELLDAAVLPTPADGPPASPLKAAEAPASRQQALNTLAVDTCTVLAALRERPARVSREGQLNPTDVARLQEWLLLRDRVRLGLIIVLATQRGWLLAADGRLRFQPGPAMAWLRATPWEQMTALFTAWRDSTDLSAAGEGPAATPLPGWNDLRRLPSLRAEGGWRNDPILARRAILDALRGLEPDNWYAIQELLAWIKTTRPDFQRPDGNFAGWYLRDVETGNYLSGFESWNAVEGRLIRFLVIGPLFWLGAVALAATAGAEPALFRLTPSGVAWLREALPPQMPRPTPLAVGEDFTVSAPLLLPLLDRFRLLRFTEPVPEPYHLGQPTRHRITRGSLTRARESGVKVESILDFLRRASGSRLPPNVAAGLTRWRQHTAAVRVSRGAVLRVEDASTLAALRADPVVAPLLGDLLSAQAVLVSEASLPQLLKALEELGYTTRIE